MLPVIAVPVLSIQGDHPPGKPGKVRELESGQGKVRETGKSQGKVRESYNHHLVGARVAKILPHFKDISIDEMSPAILEMSGKSLGI